MLWLDKAQPSLKGNGQPLGTSAGLMALLQVPALSELLSGLDPLEEAFLVNGIKLSDSLKHVCESVVSLVLCVPAMNRPNQSSYSP